MMPRSEYPRPQFVRKDWLCLNGQWEFEIDAGDSGFDRGLLERPLKQKITVPFCPESSLSGIGNTDFMNAVWYRREVEIPKAWAGQKILLHFQAVDYDASVWANGKLVGRHRGGFTPFCCDLSDAAKAGEKVTLVVRARDLNERKPVGKQSHVYNNIGCLYIRTTGIWQTVWMEPVPQVSMKRGRITPDVANGMFVIEQPLSSNVPGMKLKAVVSDSQGEVCKAEVMTTSDFSPRLYLQIPESRRKLWEPGKPHLYDITLNLVDASGKTMDEVRTYAGLRSVSIEGKAVKINGKTVFQRLVLDQGYYPDGVLTAPSEEALIADITLSMEAGFNGARLHQKVFEERFLYHADRLGYLVWGEFADWGCDRRSGLDDNQKHDITYVTQWLEALERDYSHPSIIGWCGLNETHQHLNMDKIETLDDATRAMFLAAKAMDTTRPVLDVSGYSHRVPETDVWDSHYYIYQKTWQEGLDAFKKAHAHIKEGKPFNNPGIGPEGIGAVKEYSIEYKGQPYFVSEFGGFWWNLDPEKRKNPDGGSWGYGPRPQTDEELHQWFEELFMVLLNNDQMFGYCYTQLTDVHQEQNGIFTFNRKPKFNLKRISEIQKRTAAIEK